MSVSRCLPISLMIPMLSLAFVNRAEAQNVNVSYAAPSSVVLHEPVVATLVVDNALSEAIRFDLGFDRTERLLFAVRDPKGRVVQTAPSPQGGVGRSGRISVASHRRYFYRIVLNEWISFDEVGEYQVSIAPLARIETASGQPVDSSLSGGFRVTVQPRNEPRLQQVCRELLGAIMGPSDAVDIGDAIRALRQVKDPVVVPFVREVLATDDAYDKSLLGLLLQIGTDEARAVVDEASRSTNRSRAAKARTVLASFGERGRE